MLWLLCFQYFLAEEIARLAWRLPYSMAGNYISDLGAVHCGDGRHLNDVPEALNRATTVCSPLHALMNSSFILQGCLIFFGSLLVRRYFPVGRRHTAALWVIALSGLGVLAVGLAPEDVNIRVHGLGAAVHFFSGNLGMLLLGSAFLTDRAVSRPFKPVAFSSLMAGVIGLTATLLLVRGKDLGLGTGGIERVAAYPLPLWLTGMGALLLSRPALARGEP